MTDDATSSAPLGGSSQAPTGGVAEKPFRYVHSLGMPGLLEKLDCTLLVTTYQAGKVAIFRARQGRLSMLPRTFEQAMGVAVSPSRLAIGTRYQVWILENDPQLASQVEPAAQHDACFLPRRSHVTGNIQIHEMAWGRSQRSEIRSQKSETGTQESFLTADLCPLTSDELWVVNTLFSCLCTLHPKYSFVPRWHPPFISKIVPQDRCHLNGLALRDGHPKYVTAFAETDEPDGWRPNKATTGCLIDVETGETMARGLSMPHSPRLFKGKLYVLDSGRGSIVTVDPADGRSESVAKLPGYTRGLACYGRYAFVGLSKIRETTTFGGVPIAEERDELKCGVWVVDLTTGSVVSFLEFEKDVTEIFDVQILPGIRNPSLIGLTKETVEGAFSLPPQISAATTQDLQPAREDTRHGTSGSADAAAVSARPGTILDLRFLGSDKPAGGETSAAAVYYLTYRSSACGGTTLAAKLFVPAGDPPTTGWPTSIWCHGLGDPAMQLRRWPLVGNDWRMTRGELAGRWARHGVVTLCPWLPGDGPSEPLGTYSPLSLDENAKAVADAFSVLAHLPNAFTQHDVAREDVAAVPKCDTNRLMLRTDCVSTALLVYIAARWQEYPDAAGLKAFVADDFQPSVAYYETFVGPYLCQISPVEAASIRCVWSRLIWALARQRGWPLDEFFRPKAIELLGQDRSTPVGPLSRIMGSQLIPPELSSLGPAVARAVEKDLGRTPSSTEVRNWIYSPTMVDASSLPTLDAFVNDAFYQQYFAASDPFFADTIGPFEPGIPLFLVPRTGEHFIHAEGLPSFDAMFRHMTLPKIKTLKSWGWRIEVCPKASCEGTSFSGGPAQQWVLGRLKAMLVDG